MTRTSRAVIVGACEHPERKIVDQTVAEIHAQVILGALSDAGLALSDVDAYFCDSSAPGVGPMSMIEYLGLQNVGYTDVTEIGGATYLSHVGHAAAAIEAGLCKVALCSMGDRARPVWAPPPARSMSGPEISFENHWGVTQTVHNYALFAARHMYEFGTTSEQLAAVKVTASEHASHNPNAIMPQLVTVEEVLDSPMVSDPLHRLDCCRNTDGGGAIVVVHPSVAADLERKGVHVLGHGEAHKHQLHGGVDLTYTPAAWSAPIAFEQAGLTPDDIDYASVYDSFTITVIVTLEDLGFCEKGMGGQFVADGGLRSPGGNLPVNSDGGGLCNSHPGGRGGMPKILEAVRQLRGEAHPAVQVPDCRFALAHGTGGRLGSRSTGSTLIFAAAGAL